jgi:uncharacterized protein YifE (UPF0438 family)
LRYASPAKATQYAVEEAEKLWLEYSAEVDNRTDLYVLLNAVKDKVEILDYESEKLLSRMLMQYTLMRARFGRRT